MTPTVHNAIACHANPQSEQKTCDGSESVPVNRGGGGKGTPLYYLGLEIYN